MRAARTLTLAGIMFTAAITMSACAAASSAPAGEVTRAAATVGEQCPNVGSTATALIIDDRLDVDLTFDATGINCADWSETGNPTRYSGLIVPRQPGGSAALGLEAADGASPTFSVTFAVNPSPAQPNVSSSTIAALQVKLTLMKYSDGSYLPREILTRQGFSDPWKSNASYIIGELSGKPVRIATGLTMAGDSTWQDAPATRASRGWFMRLQYAR